MHIVYKSQHLEFIDIYLYVKRHSEESGTMLLINGY